MWRSSGARLHWVTLAASLLIGAPSLVSDAVFTSMLQAGIKEEFRGRIYGSYISAVSVIGLAGTTFATLTADHIGIRLTFAIGGMILAAAGGAAELILPRRLTPEPA